MGGNTKLMIGGGVIAALTLYLGYLGAASSWQYYLTADECVARAKQFEGRRVRVSGTVAPDSLTLDAGRSKGEFRLAGREGSFPVTCRGTIPDNLREGIDVVVEGRLGSGKIEAETVLTRCSSKYASNAPEPAGREDVSARQRETWR